MQFSCSESFYKLVKNDNPANDLGRFIRCDRWQIYSMADLFDARIDDRRSASHFQNTSRASRGVPRPCSALHARLDLTVCALYVGNELVVTASEGEEVLVEVEQGTLHLFTRLPSAAVSTAQFPPNAGRTAARRPGARRPPECRGTDADWARAGRPPRPSLLPPRAAPRPHRTAPPSRGGCCEGGPRLDPACRPRPPANGGGSGEALRRYVCVRAA